MSDDLQRQLDSYATPVAAEVLRDCELMARHALASGVALPEWLGNALAKIGARTSEQRAHLAALDVDPTLDARQRTVRRREIENEVGAAVRGDLRALVRIHAVLAELVAPATPRSLAATEHAETFRQAMRSIPLIGQMLVVGLVCLAGYLLPWGALSGDGRWSGTVAQLQLLFAAGLGAAFFALFTANRYVIARTYDPKYTIVYWTRFGLGLIAGVILATILTPEVHGVVIKNVGPATVALLGGYAADAVNRILRRLVDMLVTLVRGETRDVLALHEQEMRARLADQARELRLQTAASLMDLYQRFASEAHPEELKNRLKEILDTLLAGQELPRAA